MYDELYKADPAAGDVHVNAPMGGGRYKPVPDAGDLGPARTQADIEAEQRANSRADGYTTRGNIALKSGEFSTFFKVAGVNEELGLVFGWGIVCKEAGVPYVDTQGNIITEKAMVEATTDFMKGDRMAGHQHTRMDAGSVVHSFPLSDDIAKAMGITCSKTGWMVACAPDPEMLKAFKAGKLTGFSIGGEHIEIDGQPVSAVARVA